MEAKHKVLFVDYVVRTVEGEIVDESMPGEPVALHLGIGEMIEGFEKAVAGLEPGQEADFEVAPEEAYGPRDEAMLQEIPRTEFPDGMTPEVGMVLGVGDGQGNEAQFVIAEVGAETVLCDFNHPLAGQTLRFHVRVDRVEEHDAADCQAHQHQDHCHSGCCGECSC